MKPPSHSPLPWRVEVQKHRGAVVIVAADGYFVAMQTVNLGNAKAQADAELIVAAANATMIDKLRAAEKRDELGLPGSSNELET